MLEPAEGLVMSVGSFDDSAAFRLVREIFVDHQPAGYGFAGERPRLTEADVFAQYAAPAR